MDARIKKMNEKRVVLSQSVIQPKIIARKSSLFFMVISKDEELKNGSAKIFEIRFQDNKFIKKVKGSVLRV